MLGTRYSSLVARNGMLLDKDLSPRRKGGLRGLF